MNIILKEWLISCAGGIGIFLFLLLACWFSEVYDKAIDTWKQKRRSRRAVRRLPRKYRDFIESVKNLADELAGVFALLFFWFLLVVLFHEGFYGN